MQNEMQMSSVRNGMKTLSFIHHSAFIILTSLLAGCTPSKPTTQPSDIHSRQEAALKDPFGYSVDVGKQDSVSGGGTSEMDKEGLKRDIDHVFNP